jgi:DNA-damage-inducible protein J
MNIRMDSDVKKQAQEIFSELGMDTTTAINIFLRQVIRTHSIPFPLELDIPNAVTQAAIEDAISGQNLHGPFTSVDALMEDLNAED